MHLADECPKRVIECVFCQDEFYFIKKQVWLPALKSKLKEGNLRLGRSGKEQLKKGLLLIIVIIAICVIA